MLPRSRTVGAAVAVMALAGIGLSGCTGNGSAATTGSPALPDPLPTSVQAGAVSWAAVPMGHLDQPLNTFWQLFERLPGSSVWTNQVEATAVATNGGIVLAPSSTGVLVAGVRPSNLLTYSPLVATTDGGRSWSSGVLDAGLLDTPLALAAESATRALALAGPARDPKLLETDTGLDAWRVVSDQRHLASTAAGRTCGVSGLGAVAYFDSNPVVGAACDRPGVVGILADTTAGWQLRGPALPAPLAGGRAQVLGLWPGPDGMAALLGLTQAGTVELVAAFTTDEVHWVLSAPTALDKGWTLVSVGPADGSGLFVLSQGVSGRERLEMVSGPGASWSAMPSPPPGTSTVALEEPGAPQALAVSSTVLTVWGLGTDGWSIVQHLSVPIQFGSSS
jgi:hypothetical protein